MGQTICCLITKSITFGSFPSFRFHSLLIFMSLKIIDLVSDYAKCCLSFDFLFLSIAPPSYLQITSTQSYFRWLHQLFDVLDYFFSYPFCQTSFAFIFDHFQNYLSNIMIIQLFNCSSSKPLDFWFANLPHQFSKKHFRFPTAPLDCLKALLG